jgi:hypothetical protein
MSKLTPALIILAGIVLVAVLSGTDSISVTKANAAPPSGQKYVGTKVCASCHFEQYMTWKKSKHALSFESLPAKYKADATCLKCHSTGYGQPNGFKDLKSTPQLAGNTCENCHGPGSEHTKIAQQFTNKKTLSDDEKKQVKESIWKVQPTNVCAACHMAVTHKAHDQYDKN